MRLPLRLCVVIGLGAALTGAEDAAPQASASAAPSDWAFSHRATSVRGAAFTPLWSGMEPDEAESEDSSCPDWRVRQ